MSDNEIGEEFLDVFGMIGFGADTIRTYQGANHVLRFMLEGGAGQTFNLAVDDHQLTVIRDKCSELLRNSVDAGVLLAEIAYLDDTQDPQ